MTLHAAIKVEAGSFSLEIDLRIGDEVVAVVGPNGAGKTTLLRTLAGLIAIQSGEIVIDDLIVDRPDTDVFLLPEARPIGIALQDYLLFPHLTASENIAFGLRASGHGRRAAKEIAEHWLERLGIVAQSDSLPSALSGGQQQRVALARALARDPKLILLDEPFAALDAATRGEVSDELSILLRTVGTTALLVTHELRDIERVADRVIVLEGGRCVQTGSLEELRMQPATPFFSALQRG